MNDTSHIRVDTKDRIVTVTLDRARSRNGMRPQDWVELRRVFDAIDRDPDARAIVLTGANGTFCSGAELDAAYEESSPLTPMRIVNQACEAVRDVRQPTIAKVSGYAVGAGFNLVLACDLAVADDTAKLSQIFVKRGMSLDFGGSWHLAQAMSLQRAKELAFFSEVVTAAEAFELGLLNRVVPHDELNEFVATWAVRLCELPPIAVARTKRLLNSSLEDGFASTLQREAVAQEFNATTNDTKEAINAFLEKRSPHFRGN